jgi:hypothetical protein
MDEQTANQNQPSGIENFKPARVSYSIEEGTRQPICKIGNHRPILFNGEIAYDLDLGGKRYWVHVPASYDGKEAFGLIVYISSGDSCRSVPPGWNAVLEKRKFIFVAPQDGGNHCLPGNRMALALLSALSAETNYNIAPTRIYAAGVSGGARTACDVAFYQPDVFHGTIQDCGADYFRPVPRNLSRNDLDTNGYPYGLIELSDYHLKQIKDSVRFVLVTGAQDFRRGNIIDFYRGGFAADGLHAKLIDVPNMGHSDCSAAVLEQALDFIEAGNE